MVMFDQVVAPHNLRTIARLKCTTRTFEATLLNICLRVHSLGGRLLVERKTGPNVYQTKVRICIHYVDVCL